MPLYLKLADALAAFSSFGGNTQSLGHIRPLHQHIALRLVLEGGFLPEEILPRPPLRAARNGAGWSLEYAPELESSSEQTVLGGLKSKKIDVVVSKPRVGPVLAISVKGATGAFRNLTNRMEEAIGDSTNVHVMYPGLVYGFFQVIRANRAGMPGIAPNDVAVDTNDETVVSIRRYHDALSELSGRRFVRDDTTRYEVVSLAMVEASTNPPGSVMTTFPPIGTPLRVEGFFEKMFQIYDLRFPFVGVGIPQLHRLEWSPESPLFEGTCDEVRLIESFGYLPRIA